MNGRHRLNLSMLAVALLLPGCGGDDAARDLGTRAVVIGIDGADWKIIDALVAETGSWAPSSQVWATSRGDPPLSTRGRRWCALEDSNL